MADQAAFLKGINLGNRRVKNDELRGHLEAIGLSEPAVFRSSGNVVFSDRKKRGDEALARAIESGLEDRLGYSVATFVRSGRELRAIAAADPFDAPTKARLAGKLQVILLGPSPAKKARDAALELISDEDAFAFSRRELYWLPSGGLSDSKLDFKALERLLGPVTVRTMGTIQALTAKHFAG